MNNAIIKKEDSEVKTIKEIMKEAIDSLGEVPLPKDAFSKIFDEASEFDDIKICEEHDCEMDSDGCHECNREAEQRARDDERSYWEAKGAL